jgi:hypothetical protein
MRAVQLRVTADLALRGLESKREDSQRHLMDGD